MIYVCTQLSSCEVTPLCSTSPEVPTPALTRAVAEANLQIARDRYEKAKRHTDNAYSVMISARHAMKSAKTKAKKERQSIRAAKALSDQIWLAYDRERDALLAQINELRQEASSEHQKMLACSKRARIEHGSFDRQLMDQAYQHAARRDQLNVEIGELQSKLTAAKLAAQAELPIIDHDAYNAARKAAQQAVEKYKLAEKCFWQLKRKRDKAEKNLAFAKQEYIRSQNRSAKAPTTQAIVLVAT